MVQGPNANDVSFHMIIIINIFWYKKLKFSNVVVHSAQGSVSVNKDTVELE